GSDQQGRDEATKRACDSAAELRDDIRVVCFDHPDLAKSADLIKGLELEYARDRAITAQRWHELERTTGASYVLLFRPEGVSASQRVKKADTSIPVHAFSPPGVGVPLVLVPGMEGVGPKVDSVKTSRSYTLSSSLVDLRRAKTVRTGVYSNEASTSTAEGPDASQHLSG